jgi:hypothetical protein
MIHLLMYNLRDTREVVVADTAEEVPVQTLTVWDAEVVVVVVVVVHGGS